MPHRYTDCSFARLVVAGALLPLGFMLGGCLTVAAPLGETVEAEVSASEVAESIQNTPPVADAGDDAAVEAGALVVLSGARSKDADGQRLSYNWQQVGGDVTVELKGQYSSVLRFEAPTELDAEVQLTFRLVVVDGFAFSEDEVIVTIRPAS